MTNHDGRAVRVAIRATRQQEMRDSSAATHGQRDDQGLELHAHACTKGTRQAPRTHTLGPTPPVRTNVCYAAAIAQESDGLA